MVTVTRHKQDTTSEMAIHLPGVKEMNQGTETPTMP